MKLSTTPSIVDPDPIDDYFAMNPLDEAFTEEAAIANAKKLVLLFRTEIEEYNKAQDRAKESGKNISGAAIKSAQRKRLTSAQEAALEAAKKDEHNADTLAELI